MKKKKMLLYSDVKQGGKGTLYIYRYKEIVCHEERNNCVLFPFNEISSILIDLKETEMWSNFPALLGIIMHSLKVFHSSRAAIRMKRCRDSPEKRIGGRKFDSEKIL